jgi:Family of unknown function (DUF6282)
MSALRIENAIDMHCHFGPDTIGTGAHPQHSVTGLQAAREAYESGHRAIVLKSHSLGSPMLATEIEQMVPGLRVFGGICTDYPSGGLNVDAVNAALQLGAKIVWLPTIHSHQDYLNGKSEILGIRGEGLRVTGDDGEPLPEVRAIFDLVVQYDAVLATGHVTAVEHYAVIKAFAREGKLLVTHAGEPLAGPHLTPQQCRDLADLGATIELTAQCCHHVFGIPGKSVPDMVEMIRTIGHERCTLSTDYGWTTELPHPADGMRDFLEKLWNHGMTEEELTTMVAVNPARLLGL